MYVLYFFLTLLCGTCQLVLKRNEIIFTNYRKPFCSFSQPERPQRFPTRTSRDYDSQCVRELHRVRGVVAPGCIGFRDGISSLQQNIPIRKDYNGDFEAANNNFESSHYGIFCLTVRSE